SARRKKAMADQGLRCAASRPLQNRRHKYDITSEITVGGIPCRHPWEVQMTRLSFRKLMAAFSVTLALGMLVSTADARVGGGGSMGSRGSRTFSAPPPTRTAPSTATPMQRSVTQPSSQPRAGASSPGFFGGGLLGGLAAGFIGAGLFGLLFGHGLFGGLGGFASIFGLILPIGLLVLVARLLWSMLARGQQPG